MMTILVETHKAANIPLLEKEEAAFLRAFKPPVDPYAHRRSEERSAPQETQGDEATNLIEFLRMLKRQAESENDDGNS
jgi:hypothetical protein